MALGEKWCVRAYQKGAEMFVAYGNTDSDAIDKAAEALVKRGFAWSGLPVSLGMALKAKPVLGLGQIRLVLSRKGGRS